MRCNGVAAVGPSAQAGQPLTWWICGTAPTPAAAAAAAATTTNTTMAAAAVGGLAAAVVVFGDQASLTCPQGAVVVACPAVATSATVSVTLGY